MATCPSQHVDHYRHCKPLTQGSCHHPWALHVGISVAADACIGCMQVQAPPPVQPSRLPLEVVSYLEHRPQHPPWETHPRSLLLVAQAPAAAASLLKAARLAHQLPLVAPGSPDLHLAALPAACSASQPRHCPPAKVTQQHSPVQGCQGILSAALGASSLALQHC